MNYGVHFALIYMQGSRIKYRLFNLHNKFTLAYLGRYTVIQNHGGFIVGD